MSSKLKKPRPRAFELTPEQRESRANSIRKFRENERRVKAEKRAEEAAAYTEKLNKQISKAKRNAENLWRGILQRSNAAINSRPPTSPTPRVRSRRSD